MWVKFENCLEKYWKKGSQLTANDRRCYFFDDFKLFPPYFNTELPILKIWSQIPAFSFCFTSHSTGDSTAAAWIDEKFWYWK